MLERKEKAELLQRAKKFPALALLGPRQSGKTTLVRAAFPHHRYVNLDLATEALSAAQDPEGFLKLRPSSEGLIIDEAQNVPEIFSTLLPLLDEDPRPGRFILTGSQNFLMHSKIAESLAGRIAIRTLLPLSIEEASQAQQLPKTVDEWLWIGLYPSVFLGRYQPEEWYPEYISTYVQRDVRSLPGVGDLRSFTLVLKLLAGRIGQLLDLSNLANEAGVSVNTVKRWISVLEAAYIITLLPPYHRNFQKRLVKTPKIYFCDTGVALSLLGVTSASQVESLYLRGSLFENMLVADLLKQSFNRGGRPELYFWRDHAGLEVDLVLERPEGLMALEIKSSLTLAPQASTSLIRFSELANIPCERRLLVYGGPESRRHRHYQQVGWRELEQHTGPWFEKGALPS